MATPVMFQDSKVQFRDTVRGVAQLAETWLSVLGDKLEDKLEKRTALANGNSAGHG